MRTTTNLGVCDMCGKPRGRRGNKIYRHDACSAQRKALKPIKENTHKPRSPENLYQHTKAVEQLRNGWDGQ